MSEVLKFLGIDSDTLVWQDLALCNNLDTNRFYEDYESSPRIAKQTDQVCISCPVRRQCALAAVENNEWGCWGGIFFVSGRPDTNKNAHKTPDIWEQVREGLS